MGSRHLIEKCVTKFGDHVVFSKPKPFIVKENI